VLISSIKSHLLAGNGVSQQNRFTPQRSLNGKSEKVYSYLKLSLRIRFLILNKKRIKKYHFSTDTPQQQQPYVPASEQQAPEPKKYTGSAIPSRSFKILQAMTTPENAGK